MARKYEEQGLHVPIPGLLSEIKIKKDGETIGEARQEADGWHVIFSPRKEESLHETSNYVVGVDSDFDTAVCKGYDKHNRGR